MDKERILKQAQAEASDEMEKQTKDLSMRWTYIALVLCSAVFAFIRGLRGQPVMDLCATVCYSVFAGRMYCFIKTRERFELTMALISLAVAIVATIRFFMGH